MSKKEVVVGSKSVFSITRAIAAALNLGDEGKMDSFLTKVVKTLRNEVKIHTQNLETMKFKYNQRLDVLGDELVEAKEASEAEYTNITTSNVETKSAQNSHVEIYLDRVDARIGEVQRVEYDIKDTKESYSDKVKEVKLEVKSLEVRIERISRG